MTKISSVPKTVFPSRHSQAKEDDDEEEYNMASHSAEDPVCLGSSDLARLLQP